MKVIFATTNRRKINDLINISKELNLDLEVLTLEDINYNLGEIEETGSSLFENSLIKAKAVHNFCLVNNLDYPIISDDAGLFVDSLNGQPGIYTGRYADTERALNPSLPKYECVNKLLKNLSNHENREATYKCVVTCMYKDGSYFQKTAESHGYIAKTITEPITKPYFYSVFILDNSNKTFNLLTPKELKKTYRYNALRQVINQINDSLTCKIIDK